LFYLLAGFFVDAGFLVADFGLATFLAAAGFLAAVDAGFFGVVAFLTFGLAAFFVEVFFAPVGLAALVFFAFVCFGFVVFVVLVDFGLALDCDFDAGLAILTFFDFAAVVVEDVVVAVAGADVVAELFVLAVVATFFAGFEPADFERERFFVPDLEVDDEDFFVFVDFFLAGFPPSANLNEPLAPLPFVCLKCFDLTPFLRADLRC
jgi:hypothetical protein